MLERKGPFSQALFPCTTYQFVPREATSSDSTVHSSGTTSTFFKKFFPKGIRKLLLWDGSQVWNLEPLAKIASQHFPDLREVHICRSRWTLKPREKPLIRLFSKQGIRLTYSGDDDRDVAGAMDPPGTRGLMNLCSLLSAAYPHHEHIFLARHLIVEQTIHDGSNYI